MSDDPEPSGEARLSERLKRRRAERRDPSGVAVSPLAGTPGVGDQAPDADNPAQAGFAYGGWSVTLPSVEESAPPGAGTAQRPSGSKPLLRERLRGRGDGARGRSQSAPQAQNPPTEDSAIKDVWNEGGGESFLNFRETDLEFRPGAEHAPAETTEADDAALRDLVPAPPERGTAALEGKVEANNETDRPIISTPKASRRPASGWSDLRADPDGPRGRRASAPPGQRIAGRADMPRYERTHAPIAGGGSVMIGDGLFSLIDWSPDGIAIPSAGHLHRVGSTETIELELDLGDYAVNVDVRGKVVARSSERTTWQFVDPTPTQQALLVAIADVCRDGRPFVPPLVEFDDHGPAPGDTGAPGPRSARGLGRRPLAAALSLPYNLVAAGLIASVVILTEPGGSRPSAALGPADREDVAVPRLAPAPRTAAPQQPAASDIPIRADHAAVAVERIALVSDVAATILEWGFVPGEAVDDGEALVSLALPSGGDARTVLQSPCACTLARVLAAPGTIITPGETVALLYPLGSQGHIQALFSFGKAPRLGDEVSVDLPFSGDRFAGVVESVGRLDDPQAYIGLPDDVLSARNNGVFARIRTTPAVPAALAGDPAVVTLRPEA